MKKNRGLQGNSKRGTVDKNTVDNRSIDWRYNRLKSQLEQRIHLGKTFLQVNEFARELEASFDSLEQLIDQKVRKGKRGKSWKNRGNKSHNDLFYSGGTFRKRITTDGKSIRND